MISFYMNESCSITLIYFSHDQHKIFYAFMFQVDDHQIMNEIEIIGDFIHNILEAWGMFFTVIDEMVSNSCEANLFLRSLGQAHGTFLC